MILFYVLMLVLLANAKEMQKKKLGKFKEVNECVTSLSLKTPKYRHGLMRNNKNADSVTVANGWSAFFENSNPLECAMESCEVKTTSSRCQSTYHGFNLLIQSGYPWRIDAQRFQNDWIENVCMVCSNGDQTIT